jgi:Tol biopolymer transport system component
VAIKDALDIARQLAEALEAAHDRQIVHRDLKPANIKITPGDEVKVLDFGVAKVSDISLAMPPSAESLLLPTTTHPGLIIGTPAYMSPEQATGKLVDKRADIWAFGCVFFELLTARSPFRRMTAVDTLAAVLEQEPDWEALPRTTPARVRELLKRCLQKDPRQRLRDAGDARIEIEQLLRDGVPVGDGAPRGRGRTTVYAWIGWTAAVLVAAAAIAYRPSPQARPTVETIRSEILPPEGVAFGGLAVSPDGRQLAFVGVQSGKRQLWVRTLATAVQRVLAGTDGAAHPFWSTDNLHIGFFADGKLKRIPASGGSPQVLANAPAGLGGTWSEDGVIVYSPSANAPLYRVPASSGPSTPLTHLDTANREVSHRWPAFLPDGKHVLYFSLRAQPTAEAGTSGELVVASLDGTVIKELLPNGYGARYLSGGYLAFMRWPALLAQRFNPQTLTLEGQDLTTLADEIENAPALEGSPFSVSSSGDVLVYRRRGSPSGERRDLQWFGRDGSRLATIGTPDRYWSARLSPDGRSVAVEIEAADTRATNVWIYDTEKSASPTRFTFSESPDSAPIWAPDGKSIVFGSRGQGPHFSLFRKPSDGSSGEQLLLQARSDIFADDWSRDGRFLLYTMRDSSEKAGGSIWVLPMQGTRTPSLLFRSIADDRYPHFSPDGRLVAYQSNENGRNQIYVIPFEGGGSKWQVSSDGGEWPVWRPDGRELYFLSPDRQLMAVGVRNEGTAVTFAPPQGLFNLNVYGGYGERFAATADGRRFLALVSKDDAPRPLSAVIHWSSQLK